MTRYMLDTDISSIVIRGTYPDLDSKIRTIPNELLCISVITRYELLFGIELKPDATKLKALVANFLQRVTTVPFENQAAASFAAISALLRKEGIGMGTMDAMIASHALSINATVVTNNTKHFEIVPNLKIENWLGIH
jgi:tRNA(fMet)-specific endonuclease VapC